LDVTLFVRQKALNEDFCSAFKHIFELLKNPSWK